MKVKKNGSENSKDKGRLEGKSKPMDLNIFHQESGSRKSVTNSKLPSAISTTLSADGWYIYSYDKPFTQNSDFSPYIL